MGVRADDILKDNQLIPHGLQFRRRVPLVAIQGKMVPVRRLPDDEHIRPRHGGIAVQKSHRSQRQALPLGAYGIHSPYFIGIAAEGRAKLVYPVGGKQARPLAHG